MNEEMGVMATLSFFLFYLQFFNSNAKLLASKSWQGKCHTLLSKLEEVQQ